VLPNKKEVDQFWNFKPAWQNSIDSVFRTPQSFVAYGAFKEEHLIGYGITEFESGDITQLAVHKSFRRQGVGTELLKQLIASSSISNIKVINTESSDLGMINFLKSVNLELTGKQFEMIKKL
jgi:ribosomal protein S18 acetylase RimI-like enzyme